MKLQEAKLSDVSLLRSKIKKLDDFGYKNGKDKVIEFEGIKDTVENHIARYTRELQDIYEFGEITESINDIDKVGYQADEVNSKYREGNTFYARGTVYSHDNEGEYEDDFKFTYNPETKELRITEISPVFTRSELDKIMTELKDDIETNLGNLEESKKEPFIKTCVGDVEKGIEAFNQGTGLGIAEDVEDKPIAGTYDIRKELDYIDRDEGTDLRNMYDSLDLLEEDKREIVRLLAKSAYGAVRKFIEDKYAEQFNVEEDCITEAQDSKSIEMTTDGFGKELHIGDKIVAIDYYKNIDVSNVSGITEEYGDITMVHFKNDNDPFESSLINSAVFKFDKKYGYIYGYKDSRLQPTFTDDMKKINEASASFGNWSADMFEQGGEKIFVSFDNTGKILERTISD